MPSVDAGRSANGPAAASGSRSREHLVALLTPVVAAAGYDLDDVTITAAGRRSLVRVTVDLADPDASGGIDLDAVAAVSRLVSDALDSDDGTGFAGPYVLEVSSPGVDRPLTQPRHWRRAIGRLVAVEAAGRQVLGRVVGVSDTGATIEIDRQHREFGWAELGRGQVQVEFNPPKRSGEPEQEG